MKLISWNVNGLRACENKGFSESFKQLDADFFCLQETKMQQGQLDLAFDGYKSYWNYAEKRLDYRMAWDDAFREYLLRLDSEKPVIACGDMNVAHKEIDLKNPKTNRKNAGFTDEERGKFTQLLSSGFTDSFRYLYPDKEGAYSWWSYRFKAREKNAGWRIDYFVVSNRLADGIKSASIHNEVFGSDHCPVELVI